MVQYFSIKSGYLPNHQLYSELLPLDSMSHNEWLIKDKITITRYRKINLHCQEKN